MKETENEKPNEPTASTPPPPSAPPAAAGAPPPQDAPSPTFVLDFEVTEKGKTSRKPISVQAPTYTEARKKAFALAKDLWNKKGVKYQYTEYWKKK